MELNICFKPDTYGIWEPLLPACHSLTPLVTRLSSGPPTHTFPFRWKTQNTLCLCSSLKERQRPTRPWTRKKKRARRMPPWYFPQHEQPPHIAHEDKNCRLFSAFNRIKTGTRATMLTDRLNSLSLLSFERELTDSLEYKEILAVFRTKPRSLLL